MKPYFSSIASRGYDVAVFLDPDILVLGDLSSVVSKAADHAITLTPHLLSPLAGRDRAARELNILQSGTFNAGFVGVSRGDIACRFLRWWQERTAEDCSHRVMDGVYFDQRWLDLAPALFEDVSVRRIRGATSHTGISPSATSTLETVRSTSKVRTRNSSTSVGLCPQKPTP